MPLKSALMDMRIFALLVIGLLSSSVLSGQNADGSGRKPVTFTAMGCGPYSPTAEEAIAHFLKVESATSKSSFLVHCGDIVTGKVKTWPESQYSRVAGILRDGVTIPTFIVPGDNEWNDQLDIEGSWENWTKHFLRFDEQWKLPSGVGSVERQENRPENFAFVLDGVLFLGINKVGGLVHDEAEWDRRLRDNADWVVAQFDRHGGETHSAVIFAQAQAEGKNMVFANKLTEVGDAYGKPILYLHADGHKWIVEPGKWGANVTRLQLDLVNEDFPPVQVTVTGDPGSPFQFDRRRDNPRYKYRPESCIWSMRAGGEGNDKIRGIAADSDGSIFVTGEVSPGCDFGGHVVPSGGSLDFVVAKLDPKGHVKWAAVAGGEGIDRGYGVSPAGDGGCFVTGHFQSASIRFGEIELVNSGDYDGFVVRFDKEGEVLWAQRFGGASYDYGHGIATAPDGCAVVAGTVANSGDFGPREIKVEKGRSAVLAKLSPEGKTIWVQTASGPATSGHQVAVGGDGEIYLAGYARGKITWSESVSTENKIQDICVSKYDAAGVFQWVRTTGGEANGLATSVAVDSKSGNVCIAGMFQGKAVFGSDMFETRGKHDFYMAVLSSNGEFLNAHQGGGVETDYALGATALPGGGFAVTGELNGEGEFGGKHHKGKGERDSYVVTLNSDGSKVGPFTLAGGVDHDLSYAIAATANDTVVISGAFRNETQFGALKLHSEKGNDIFVAKLPLKTP